MFIYGLPIFLTSTAFVSTNAKYGIPPSRYTVFLQNCPLGYDPKRSLFFCRDIFLFSSFLTDRSNAMLTLFSSRKFSAKAIIPFSPTPYFIFHRISL